MSDWVRNDAKRLFIILRDSGEIWRNIKLAIETATNDWISIYNKPNEPELEVSDCENITENCIRVRTLKVQPEKFVEVRYTPAAHKIEANGTVRPDQNFKMGFLLKANADASRVEIFDNQKTQEPKTAADISKEILQPLFTSLGFRVPINIQP